MAEKVSSVVNSVGVDSLSLSGVNTIAQAGAFAMAQRFQDEVAHARRVQLMAEAHLGKVLANSTSPDPVEAVATSRLLKGETESSLTSLLSQLIASQQATKVAESTPPESSVTTLLAQLIALVTQAQIQTKTTETTPPVTTQVATKK